MIKTVRAHQPWSNLFFFFCDNPTLLIIFYPSFNHIWDDSLCSKSSFPFPFPLLAIFSPFPQTESLFTGNVWCALLPGRVDLPQVDLLASGASLFWFLAAKRPTASDEVARGRPAPYEIRRRTFLKVSLAGSAKKEQDEKSCIVSHVKFILCDHIRNSLDHSVLQSIDITRRNLMLITLRD